MNSFLLRLAAISLLLLLPIVSACGDDDDDPERSNGVITQTPNVVPSIGGPQEQPPPAQELDSEPVSPSNGVVEIAASGSQFTDNFIRMTAGETAIIRVTNEDNGVTHNLRIAGIDGQFNTEDDAVTTPEAIEGGQVGELTFAPPTDGAYTFQCDFHPTSMGGEIVVGDVSQ
jgi:plastocyanin